MGGEQGRLKWLSHTGRGEEPSVAKPIQTDSIGMKSFETDSNRPNLAQRDVI